MTNAPPYTLLLNADFRPLRLISWQTAMLLVLGDKADLVTGYEPFRVRSARQAFAWPAVVRLVRWVDIRGRVRFNRANLLARDGYACTFCGVHPRKGGRPDLEALTLDHVVPRAQSRDGFVWLPWSGRRVTVTCWENVTTACQPCNLRKADRTPAQAGMNLRRLPKVPHAMDLLRMTLTRVHVPDEWKDFLPAGSEWREYWTAELDG